MELGQRWSWNPTPLQSTAETGKEDLMKLLIDAGARLDTQNDDGDTAAHLATMRGHVKVLAVFGADMTIKNNAGKTALNIAMDKGNDTIMGIFHEGWPTYRSSG